jgi:CRP-like cAMP-binding protein
MTENQVNDKLSIFKKNLSNCVNVHKKTFYNKELILTYNSKRQIGFITYGKASIIKTDINGNKILLKELKENDIFSNKFYKYTEDNIYVISNSNICEVTFIDYYTILRDCTLNCPFHNNLVTYLFDLLIEDNRQQNEKIELLSKRKVEDKILFFLKKRMNENNVFKVTTSYKAIAEYISVDRSNFMRELSKMEEKNIIKKEGKTITIL